MKTHVEDDGHEVNDGIYKYQFQMLYYTPKKGLAEHRFYFDKPSEFEQASSAFIDLNLRSRDGKERNLGVLVNPISGKKASGKQYKTILKPMLDFCEIDHEMIETTCPSFIDDFVQGIVLHELPYTEFVTIGGDGLFSQLINAFSAHPDMDELFKLPIGVMPGGSCNALSCDLGGKDPYMAALYI